MSAAAPGVVAPAELVDWAIRESDTHANRYRDADWTWRR